MTGNRIDPATDARPARRIAITPITCWAALGLGFLAFQAVVFGRWIADGNPRAIPADYDISTPRAVQTWIAQGITIVLITACVVIVARDAWKAGRLTFQAAITAGFATTFWIAPVANAFDTVVVQNRYALNVEGWGRYLPFWRNPTEVALPETYLLAAGLMYIPLIVWVWAQLWLVNRVRRWRPQWSVARLLPVVLLAGLLVNVVFEIWLTLGSVCYGYPFVNQDLALFGGHWYQLPIGPLIAGLFMPTPAVLVWVHAQRYDREPVLFSGEHRLAPRLRGWARFLACAALANISILIWAFVDVLSGRLTGHGPLPADFPTWLWPR